jgi:simple sugar transport system permease protein
MISPARRAGIEIAVVASALIAAFAVAGIVLAVIGADPIEAFRILVYGAFGYPEAVGYTLYYATSYMFAGLAVWVALKGGIFNIGGEGQAYLGGLGAALPCLFLDNLPPILLLPLAMISAAMFGAGWAAIPGYLQGRRQTHVVVTTIMFNFIAGALMTYLLNNWLLAPGGGSPETRPFAPQATMPALHEILALVGIEIAHSPANLSLVVALIAVACTWTFMFRTVWGYETRVVGANPHAARYAGIDPGAVIVRTMLISGALVGLVAVNEVMGVHKRLILDFPAGAGFVGIAVALMAGESAIGLVLAAVLFAALAQGSLDLVIDMPMVNREIVRLIQGVVILFCGALPALFRKPIVRLLSPSDTAARPAGAA